MMYSLGVLLAPLLPQSTQQAASPGETPQLPEALLTLPSGSMLKGFVLTRDGQGFPVLRTPLGDLLIQNDLFLKIGTEVTLRVDAAAARGTNAQLITINGQPAQLYAAKHFSPQTAQMQDRISLSPQSLPLANPPTAANPTITVQAVNPQPLLLPATVLAPAASLPDGAPQSVAQAPAPPQGETAKALPQPSATPAAPPGLSLKPGTQVILQVMPAATPASHQASSPAFTPPLPQTQPSGEKILTPAPPGEMKPAALPLPPTPLPGQMQISPLVTGRVAAHPHSPLHIVIQSPLGSFRLPAAPHLTPGAEISFRLAALPAQDTESADTPPAAPASLKELATSWPAMKRIVSMLNQTDDSGAPVAALIRIIPHALQTPETPRLGTGMLLFLHMLQGGGHLREFFGKQTTQKLEQSGQASLLTQAEQEVQVLRQATLPGPSGWMAFFVPVLVGEELQQLRWFMRKRKARDDAKEKESTHFLVEMDYTIFGAMQLDGLVRDGTENASHLDLIIRSHFPIPQEHQHAIMEIWSQSSEITGIRGGLSFQTAKHFALQPLQEILAQETPEILLA